MPRPAKRARVDEAQSAVYAHQEEDEEHDDYPEDEEDDEDDMGDDDPDADGDPDTDGDREAQALVQALGDGADQQGGGGGGGAPEEQKHENIVDYCYRMGYFPASERFPSAVTAGRFRSAPLRPQRTLDKNPLTRRSWHPKKPANWCAVLLQCGGQEVSDACTRCAEGQGMWTQCVVPNDWATSWITRGACANCYMDGRRASCSRGFGSMSFCRILQAVGNFGRNELTDSQQWPCLPPRAQRQRPHSLLLLHRQNLVAAPLSRVRQLRHSRPPGLRLPLEQRRVQTDGRDDRLYQRRIQRRRRAV